MADDETLDLSLLAAGIVAAYVSNNKVGTSELAPLITTTFKALSAIGEPAPPAEQQAPKPDKAAIRKSLNADHLTSFIDGKRYKSLKRHLTTHGTTPAEYRQTYGLPSDYPMVAPSYSAQRSALAKSLGLGRKSQAAEAAASPAPAKKGPGRPRSPAKA